MAYVRFIIGDNEDAEYGITISGEKAERRVSLNRLTGEYRGMGWDITPAASTAVAAFIAKRDAEYRKWQALHPGW